MKTIIASFVLLLFIGTVAFGQKKVIDRSNKIMNFAPHDLAAITDSYARPFDGLWVWTSGNDRFEVLLQKNTFLIGKDTSDGIRLSVDMTIGWIKYAQSGKTVYDDLAAKKTWETRSIQGNAEDEGVMKLLIADPVHQKEYIGKLVMDPKDKTKATLTLSLTNTAPQVLKRTPQPSRAVNVKWHPNMTKEERAASIEQAHKEARAKNELEEKKKPRTLTVDYPTEMVLRRVR